MKATGSPKLFGDFGCVLLQSVIQYYLIYKDEKTLEFDRYKGV